MGRLLNMLTVLLLVCVTLGAMLYLNTWSDMLPSPSTLAHRPSDDHNRFPREALQRSPYTELYNEITECITTKSNEECGFPLLSAYHQHCGHFPRLTSWQNIAAKYPKTSMISSLCRLRPILSASKSLEDYIKERNVTSIALFGDSNGGRSYKALISLLQPAFKCKEIKREPAGFHTQLHYYTVDSGIHINNTVERTCQTCQSTLNNCSSGNMTVSVEYISMFMTRKTVINLKHPVCKSAHPHPLCFNMSQQEYVLKHYLHRKTFPQLILYFGSSAHDRNRPLADAYDGMLRLQQLFITHVPPSTHVIWYDYARFSEPNTEASVWHEATEGPGFHVNEKLEAENYFLSKLLVDHRNSSYTPYIYSFFDISHMKVQLRAAWETGRVHSIPDWYKYVVGYTATMLHTLPVN